MHYLCSIVRKFTSFFPIKVNISIGEKTVYRDPWIASLGVAVKSFRPELAGEENSRGIGVS